jgi:hypothetical protein
MGNAHALVINKTHKKICIITFNQADLLYTSKSLALFPQTYLSAYIQTHCELTSSSCAAYTNLYVIMPGESIQVEAATDPIGLKIGIVYDAAPEGKILMYQMWKVKNGSVLTITYVNGGDISTFGGEYNSLLMQSAGDR